jgi:membrane-bound ClpP family serine protease
MSSQVKSDKEGRMKMSEYEESQAVSLFPIVRVLLVMIVFLLLFLVLVQQVHIVQVLSLVLLLLPLQTQLMLPPLHFMTERQ